MNEKDIENVLYGLVLHKEFDSTLVLAETKKNDHTIVTKIVPKNNNIDQQIHKNPQIHNTDTVKITDKIIDEKLQHVDLSNIRTLDELRKAIDSIDSSLKHLSTNTVFGTQYNNAKIMVIGEAPGADEDLQGEPFVGQSGQLLEDIFNSIALSRKKNIYITNILPWRPPGNRTPTSDEMQFFLPYVKKHIQIVNPKLLILVGNTSYKTLLKSNMPISQARGSFFQFDDSQNNIHIPVFVVFHPSYLLRVPNKKEIMWQDMLILQEYCIKNNLL